MFKPRRKEPTIVITPLPSQVVKDGEGKGAAGSRGKSGADPCLRAANEDDDGYDPYSDRREEAPLFERNPWD